MNIKELLIPNYLNEIEAQDANIQETQANTQNILSAANLNNTQSNRINALLPGELTAQGLENEGLGIQNEGSRITNRGNEIINILNSTKIANQNLANKQLEMQIGYMDTDKEIERNNIMAETALKRTQAGQAAAATKQILTEVDAQTRELMMQQYPKVAATMKWVNELYQKGDVPGANQLYQSLLKTLPPEFLQFEGKSGVDLLGPEITAEDDPKVIEMFSIYAEELVPKDSQMGARAIQSQADDAAMQRQRAQDANEIAKARIDAGASSQEDAVKLRKAELEVEQKAREVVVPQLASAIVGNKVAKSQLFDDKGNIANPAIAEGFNLLADFATRLKINNSEASQEILKQIPKQFTYEEKLDLPGWGEAIKGAIIPTVPRQGHRGVLSAKESFLTDIEASLERDQNLTPEQAYQKVLRERITAYTDLFE